MKIALGQFNPTVGDFSGNLAKMADYTERAKARGADLILFPELSICGYPTSDLVEKPLFIRRAGEAVQALAAHAHGIAVICGYPSPATASTGKAALNSAALLRDGKVQFVQSKMLLPTYDVFDELRNFAPASHQELIDFEGRRVALAICEDAWNDKQFWLERLYDVDPIEELIKAGGNFILNISASPFSEGKIALRRRMLQSLAKRHKTPVVLVNQVGGNDSLVFDGSSVAIAPDGRIVAQALSFEEDLIVFDSESMSGDMHPQCEGEEEAIYSALVLGTRDYVRKCGFKKVLLGLSGGIDSALTAAVAVDALGPDNVMGLAMPSQFSSQGSLDDAEALARNLGIRLDVLPITPAFDALRQTLAPVFAGLGDDVTEENLQSRVRGNLLMAVANKFGALVLTTGNKSELAVGYCTLYGDMAGALAVIGDVSKTMVYRLSAFVNRKGERIPQSTIDKPPSAELRPDQLDTDSLPPYEVLDPIIEHYVEEMKSAEEIERELKLDPALVRRILRMVERAEYKRQQAAPCLKVSPKAFGIGRRFPIAARSEVI